MVILAVDNNPDRLWTLVKNLRLVFPKDTIEYTHDPLMAGKFCCNNQIDMMFAASKMRRMDGEALKQFVKRKLPNVKVFIMTEDTEFDEFFISENCVPND